MASAGDTCANAGPLAEDEAETIAVLSADVGRADQRRGATGRGELLDAVGPQAQPEIAVDVADSSAGSTVGVTLVLLPAEAPRNQTGALQRILVPLCDFAAEFFQRVDECDSLVDVADHLVDIAVEVARFA